MTMQTNNSILRLTRMLPGVAMVLLTMMAGCGGQAARSASGAAGSVFRIGYQKGGASNILRLRGGLDRQFAAKGIRLEWIDFPAGPQMLEAMGAGSIDLGSTGDAPVAFALAAGQPIVYVANTPPGDETGDSRAILVPKNSPLRSVAELRGKRIAVQKGSGTHNFLVQALEKAGVPYKDTQPVYLAPPDARPAFESGRVDAWAIWDPYLAIAQRATQARTLVNAKGIITAGGFYLSSRQFAQRHPDWLKIALAEIDATGRWSAQNPHEAAQILAPYIKLEPSLLEQVQRRAMPASGRYVGLRPVDESVMDAQQAVADNFTRIGLLPAKVNVRAGLLTPQEYAALTPDSLRAEPANAKPELKSTRKSNAKPVSERVKTARASGEPLPAPQISQAKGGTP